MKTNLSAQQALDKKAENARELGLDYEPAQQQEPAWLTFLRNNPAASCEIVGAWLRGHAEHLTGESFYFREQPAQRKPLTDDRLRQIASNAGLEPSEMSGEVFYALRCVADEAAHNTKENT